MQLRRPCLHFHDLMICTLIRRNVDHQGSIEKQNKTCIRYSDRGQYSQDEIIKKREKGNTIKWMTKRFAKFKGYFILLRFLWMEKKKFIGNPGPSDKWRGWRLNFQQFSLFVKFGGSALAIIPEQWNTMWKQPDFPRTIQGWQWGHEYHTPSMPCKWKWWLKRANRISRRTRTISSI